MPASKTKPGADVTTWYRVSAPYVTAKTMTQDGARIVGLYTGAPLPFDIPQDMLEHLVSMELAEPYPLGEAEQPVLAQARGLTLPKKAAAKGDAGKDDGTGADKPPGTQPGGDQGAGPAAQQAGKRA